LGRPGREFVSLVLGPGPSLSTSQPPLMRDIRDVAAPGALVITLYDLFAHARSTGPFTSASAMARKPRSPWPWHGNIPVRRPRRAEEYRAENGRFSLPCGSWVFAYRAAGKIALEAAVEARPFAQLKRFLHEVPRCQASIGSSTMIALAFLWKRDVLAWSGWAGPLAPCHRPTQLERSRSRSRPSSAQTRSR